MLRNPWVGLTQNITLFVSCRSLSRIGMTGRGNDQFPPLAGSPRNPASHRDTSLPPLLYIQYPWKYLAIKLKFIKLKLFWDRGFREEEFTFRTKRAAVVIPELLREQRLDAIQKLTTKSAFLRILNDIQWSSADDPRLKLMKFRVNDITHAIPFKVDLIRKNGRNYCIVDMFFVGMRNITDFDNPERDEILEDVRKYDENYSESKEEIIPGSMLKREPKNRRAILAEISTRFCREYGADEDENWTMASYEISNFDVLAF